MRSSSFLLALSSGRRENTDEVQDDSQESSVRSASGLCASYCYFFSSWMKSLLSDKRSPPVQEADDERVRAACSTTSDACALVPGIAPANINKSSVGCL